MKEQIIISVKKTLNNAGHIDAKIESILAKFAKKKIQQNRLFFADCFLVKFPPEISREIGRFFYEFAPENPSKFEFFPLKSREIGRFFRKF